MFRPFCTIPQVEMCKCPNYTEKNLRIIEEESLEFECMNRKYCAAHRKNCPTAKICVRAASKVEGD